MPNAVVATTTCAAPDDEVVLDARALLALEAGVVVLGPEPVAARARARAPRSSGASARTRSPRRRAAREALDEDLDPVLGVGDLLDVVAKVRPHHARVDDVERASERLPDVPRRLRRRRRRHPEERRLAERLQTAPDEEVVGPEVVPPHAHAVHLVHDDEPDADLGEELDEARLPEALGRRVDEARLAGGHCGEPFGRLLRR